MKKFLSGFSLFQLIIIAMMASLGIAVKPVLVPLAQIITGPLYIPGGAITGGIYMMFIVLGAGLVKKTGTATLISIVQAIMVVSTGIFGTHGIMSFITYILPGVAVDLFFKLIRHNGCCIGCCLGAGIIANITGTFLVNLVFFRLPLIPLILCISSAALSGGLGGIIAYSIIKRFDKLNIGGISA